MGRRLNAGRAVIELARQEETLPPTQSHWRARPKTNKRGTILAFYVAAGIDLARSNKATTKAANVFIYTVHKQDDLILAKNCEIAANADWLNMSGRHCGSDCSAPRQQREKQSNTNKVYFITRPIGQCATAH